MTSIDPRATTVGSQKPKKKAVVKSRTAQTIDSPLGAATIPCKLYETQRAVIGDLWPDIEHRLKLEQPNQRKIELTRAEIEFIIQLAEAEKSHAKTHLAQTLYKIGRALKIAVYEADRSLPKANIPKKGVAKSNANSTASSSSSIKQKLDPSKPLIYQFHIELEYSDPPIWRQVEVKDSTLEQLHLIIQGAMGWDGTHLAEFVINETRYLCSSVFGCESNDPEEKFADEIRISELVPANRRLKLKYTYDFGDSWDHVVALTEVRNAIKGTQYPLCSDGEQACPPEDCGGIPGYYNVLEALSDPDHVEHDLAEEWLGEFDPEKFNAKTATRTLRKILRESEEESY